MRSGKNNGRSVPLLKIAAFSFRRTADYAAIDEADGIAEGVEASGDGFCGRGGDGVEVQEVERGLCFAGFGMGGDDAVGRREGVFWGDDA